MTKLAKSQVHSVRNFKSPSFKYENPRLKNLHQIDIVVLITGIGSEHLKTQLYNI